MKQIENLSEEQMFEAIEKEYTKSARDYWIAATALDYEKEQRNIDMFNSLQLTSSVEMHVLQRVARNLNIKNSDSELHMISMDKMHEAHLTIPERYGESNYF